MQMEHIEDIYELSPMQQGLLFHTLHAPESNAYFEQFCWQLEGALDRVAFRQAWQRLCDRHSILRTAFCWEGLEQPYQVVYRQVGLPWEQQDWQHLSSSDQEKSLQDFLQKDRDRSFVLQQAPLMRCTLISIEEQAYYFIWSHHHLLLDGWSTALLFKEILTDYQALSQQPEIPPSPPYQGENRAFKVPLLKGDLGGFPNVEPLITEALNTLDPRPYRDYILWLQQQNPSHAEPFWRQYLQDFIAPTTIHLEQRNLKDFSFEVDRAEQQLHLSVATTQSLKFFAQQQRLTLNTLVQAAWAIVLSRYNGESDVVFGTVVSGRPPALPGVESMVGLFINTLPLRVNVPPEADLIPWLQQLQLQQIERQEYEYTSLVQIQRWSEVPATLPLFDSILVFENYPIDASVQSSQTNLAIERISTFEQTNYPLTITASPSEQLLFQVAYHSRQFTNEAIARLLRHLQTVLEHIIHHPQTRLQEIPLLTPTEQHQLLIEWNHLESKFEPEPTLCLHHLFEAQVERTPDAVALIHEKQQFTYRELNQRANQLAHYLQSLGVAPEVLVGVCLPRSPDLIISLLAILKAGGAYVPLDPNYPEERLSFVLDDAQVAILLTLQSHPRVGDLAGKKASLTYDCIDLDRDWHTITQLPDTNPACAATGDNLAYVIYTSGSTGKPKGVMIQQRSLVHFVESAVQVYGIAASDRVLQFASISFDAAVEEIFPTLVQGATLVLRTETMIESMHRFVQACRDGSITVLDLPTAFWHQLVQSLSTSITLPESLRLVIIGGEKALPTSLNLWQQRVSPQVRLINSYGPTEATVVATCCEISGFNAVEVCEEISIGKPLPNVQVYVLDPNLKPLPVGVSGELYIGGEGVARGYLNRPELTAECFIPNPFIHPSHPTPYNRIYRTGDRARYRSDGHLEFLGRIDYQVKIRGFRIEPGEIEAVFSQHPTIQNVIVLAREEQPGQIRLIAYVVPTSGTELHHQTLHDFLQQRLPSYMLPSAFVRLNALPLTPSGKIDRQALPSPDFNSLESAATAPPSTPTEIQLAQLWTELLNVPVIGIHDNFFELGGHSLLTTQLLSRIHVTFAIDLSLRQLFESPTLAELAALVDQQLKPSHKEERTPSNSIPGLIPDIVLSDDIQPLFPFSSTVPHHLLLTGATGFLGSFLLAELLRQTTATIYCLVRAEDENFAQQRLQQSLQAYQIWQEEWRDRIIPILGDLAQPDLGLSSDQFQLLAETVDPIYHNGAWVHHALPYASLKAANVLGTEAVLRLACQHHAKPVHFISTTSVFSPAVKSGVSTVWEQDIPTLETAPLNGYAQTKWVAERLIRNACDRGLPVSIYRPGRIAGDSQTGVFNANDLLYRLIIGCVQLGSAPEGEMQIDFVPVDYVSQAIVHLSQQPSALDQAFHLVNPHPLSADKLINKIRSLGYPLQQLPYEEWRSQLLKIAQHQPDHPLYPLIPLFPPANETTSGAASLQFDCRNTLAGLAGTSIHCPPVSDSLLDTYFTYLMQNGNLHPPISGAIYASRL